MLDQNEMKFQKEKTLKQLNYTMNQLMKMKEKIEHDSTFISQNLEIQELMKEVGKMEVYNELSK
jgi:hypothetical protein